MKHTLLLSLLLMGAMGCETKENKFVCNCIQKDKIQLFVSSSIKNANNMSDEEMEDVIDKLYTIGVKVNCDQRTVVYSGQRVDRLKSKLDSCDTVVIGID